MHLIQAHGYPKEYFFAVTNKGVGGLLKKWGEGASMLRRPWKPRENEVTEDQDGEETAEDDQTTIETDASAHRQTASEAGDDDEDEILLEKIQIERPAARPTPTNGTAPPPNASASQPKPKPKGRRAKHTPDPRTDAAGDVDSLTNALDSLSLVPSSIQFGRGAKRGALYGSRAPGHARRGSADRRRGGGGAEGEKGYEAAANGHGGDAMDVDPSSHGRGGRPAPPFLPRGGAIRGLLRGNGRGLPSRARTRRN